MKTLLVGSVFAVALMAGRSDGAVAHFDQSANMEAARPIPLVSYGDTARAIRVVDTRDQLSDQERALIGFLKLKAEAEQNAR